MTKRCPRCDETKAVTEFYKSSRTADGLRCYCKACGNRDSINWAKANPERAAAAHAKHYASHRDALAADVKARRAANPARFAEYRARANKKGRTFFNAQRRRKLREFGEELRAKARAYRRANAGAYNAWYQQYRAHKVRALVSWANLDAVAMLYDVAARVTACLGIPHEVDHIVPLRGAIGRKFVVSGLHVEYNLQIVPRSVNRSKSNIVWPHMPALEN